MWRAESTCGCTATSEEAKALLHAFDTRYVICAMPAERPVMTPALSIAAIAGALLLHVPPCAESASVVVVPAQRSEAPEIVPAVGAVPFNRRCMPGVVSVNGLLEVESRHL